MSKVMERLARRQSGVTLIELLTVIVVLGILSTIAVTSYRSFTLRANRTDATTTLLRIQVAQEKFFLQNNRYASGSTELTAAPPAGLGVGLRTGDLTPNGYYAITLAPGATAGVTYTATAIATAGQTQDSADCQTLTMDEQGQRGPANAVSAGCWK